MIKFYKRAISLSAGMILYSVLLSAFCFYKSFLNTPLMPADASPINWQIGVFADSDHGGTSTIDFIETNERIHYRYRVNSTIEFPYVGPKLVFKGKGSEQLIDLSPYSEVSFGAKCEVENEMTFHLHSFDRNVTAKERFLSYRIAEKDFTCRPKKLQYVIALDDLRVPIWWLTKEKQDVTDWTFWPEKTHAISFDNDRRGVVNKDLEVELTNIVLIGRNWSYVWFAGINLLVSWLVLTVYLFRFYTVSLTATVKKRIIDNKPLIAYQQLSIEPHKDKEKSQLLHLMATEYSNPELNIDYVISKLGLNRNKINRILKEELGLTFVVYLNRLRLSEAAKHISEDEDKTISDIAYAVGYNNISYFNRLFKAEYGCAPKKFKGVYKGAVPDAGDDIAE